MLVHFPPSGNTQHCEAMQEQWRAMEAFYADGKARASARQPPATQRMP